MYFAVIWKNKVISLAELQLVKPKNIQEINPCIISFDTDSPEKLGNLWWIIKWWEILSKQELESKLYNIKLLWTTDKDFWIKLKKQFWIKRFKLTEILKTDKEVKEKWLEIIKLKWDYWMVKWYQNIWLYEEVDFWKPSRSMKMWMMPAKLAHILLNIWLSKCPKHDDLTIYDPFVWSWTTWFLANHFWYDFVWSDINIFHVEKNKLWRFSTLYSNNKSFEIFQHDIMSDISNDKLNWDILIVSEWWLWPIVTEKTSIDEVSKFQNEVWKLYKWFISTISKLKKKWRIKSVFTIPYYIWQSNFLEQEIKNWSRTFSRNFSVIDEIYSRENQKVGRKIIILE